MRVERLTERGSLADWLKETASETDKIALDLEWHVRGGRNDEIYSGAVTGPTADDVAVFGAELLPELMQTPEGVTFLFHHAPSDLKHLAWAGVPLHEKYEYRDTLILSHLLQENGSHSLGDLVKETYGDDYKAEFKAKYALPEDAPAEENDTYNAKDVYYTLSLFYLLSRQLLDDGVPETLVSHVHALQRPLLDTEIQGVGVDRAYLMELGVRLKTQIEDLLPKMRSMVADEISVIECDAWVAEIEKRKTPAGRSRVPRPTFSFDSSKQLIALLYDQLGLERQYNEKTKNVSVDWDSLEKLKDKHAIVAAIQEYRELAKIYGTYVEGTLERLVDGRIFPSFNVAGTATGRISHSNPNMGNLPRAGGIRGMFIPDPGCVFVSADFSQLEVCLSAHFTRDPNLLRIINEGASQHDITAAALGIERTTAKNINFACQYGAGAFKVARMLGVSNEQGEKALEKYWQTYSGQKRVMDECAAKVDRGEPIISPFGRRRRFELRKRQSWDSAYRQAWNALVQGTGSDCTSRAFYLADESLRSRGFGRALFTVHDEILVQVKEEYAEEAQKILLETMTAVGEELGLTIALKAQGSGPMPRWQD